MRSVLLIGNHLSRHGHTIKPCEELAVRLRAAGWAVFTASSRLSPTARLAEMMASIWREHRRYAVANIDVYSGRAFAWAEASAYSLRACRKPFTITLHGGALPEFAARWPRRMRRLIALAPAVVAPSAYLAESFRPWRADIAQIANGIELRQYRFRERSHVAPRLLWLRSFHEIYDPVLAIEALAELRREIPQATLTMIGPDKGDGSLARSIDATERLGIRDAVHFEGLLKKSKSRTSLPKLTSS
ncbi:MAG: glycosyltransferase [Bryobacterales bacterium]